MSFRRMPFQFSTTDPVERQRELERRFGLPVSNMYVDVPNSLSTSAVSRETNSPRLQHRVPIFVEGHDKPIQSSVDAMGPASETKKPNVRIIPIEVEGAEKPSTRHRTFSGPAGMAKQNGSSMENTGPSTFKSSMEDLSQPSKVKHTAGPRIHNIPIQIEGTGSLNADKTKKKSSMINGYMASKLPNDIKSPLKEQKVEPKSGQRVETEKEQKKVSVDPVENALKKIQDILAEFQAYEKGVQEFCGTTKDKQYRYLDEMLTRCMLKLDELDTMGNENLRCARKSAVRQIQASIDLLESKANPAGDTEMKQVPNEVPDEKVEGSDVEMQDALPESQENSSSTADEVKSPENSNEVEMKEKEREVQASPTPACEDVKSSEAGTADVLNQVIDKVEENDVEMHENNEVAVDSTTGSELASDVQIEASENPIKELLEEKPQEFPEVELDDVQAPKVSFADKLPVTENCDAGTEEIKLDTEGTAVIKDVEMNDVQDSEVNSTVLDSQFNTIEFTKQGTGEPDEQCIVDSSQLENKDTKDVDESKPEVTTDDAKNCVLASEVIDSSNTVDSSQN